MCNGGCLVRGGCGGWVFGGLISSFVRGEGRGWGVGGIGPERMDAAGGWICGNFKTAVDRFLPAACLPHFDSAFHPPYSNMLTTFPVPPTHSATSRPCRSAGVAEEGRG